LTSKKNNSNTSLDYWIKACKWFLINSAFGLFPLLFMAFVAFMSDGRVGSLQVDHLIYEGGILLFVMIALMGAVMVDYLLSGFENSGISVFVFYIFPILILGFVTTEFMLICTKNIEKEVFAVNSWTTIIVIVLSFLYSTLVKADLFLREDARIKKHQKHENS